MRVTERWHVRRVIMVGKARRRVRRVSMLGKASRGEGAQFSRLFSSNSLFSVTFGELIILFSTK